MDKCRLPVGSTIVAFTHSVPPHNVFADKRRSSAAEWPTYSRVDIWVGVGLDVGRITDLQVDFYATIRNWVHHNRIWSSIPIVRSGIGLHRALVHGHNRLLARLECA